MKCHNVLGISERASKEEILSAYSHKIVEVEQYIDVSPSILERKRQELTTAKEECLIWRDKSFPSRISSRVSEFSSQVTSPNRLNEFCIGPCSCCDWCCGIAWSSKNDSCCVDCCGMGCGDSNTTSPAIYCDIVLYAGIGIAFITGYIKANAEEERKQAEERAAKEKERIAKLQSSKQECHSTLKSMLEVLSVESAQNALSYITGKPESVPTRDEVDREFAINEALQYIDSIDRASMKSIYNHHLEDAIQYLKLLEIINPGSRKNKALTSSINNVMLFLQAQTPYIITAEYAKADMTLVNELTLNNSSSSTFIGSSDLKSFVWSLALDSSFDFYSYRALIKQLYDLGMTVDMISSLIYIDSKYGRDTAESVLQSYWDDINSFISKSSPITILSLASISAWCDNSTVEAFALKELNKKQGLPEKLRERYSLITS